MKKPKQAIINNESKDADLKKIIGGKIKRVRKRKERTDRWVAEQLDIARVTLTQIENGKNNVSAALLWKIAHVLHCDIKEFFPSVPDSNSLSQTDIDLIAQEDKKAAEFAKKAFRKNIHNI